MDVSAHMRVMFLNPENAFTIKHPVVVIDQKFLPIGTELHVFTVQRAYVFFSKPRCAHLLFGGRKTHGWLNNRKKHSPMIFVSLNYTTDKGTLWHYRLSNVKRVFKKISLRLWRIARTNPGVVLLQM